MFGIESFAKLLIDKSSLGMVDWQKPSRFKILFTLNALFSVGGNIAIVSQCPKSSKGIVIL